MTTPEPRVVVQDKSRFIVAIAFHMDLVTVQTGWVPLVAPHAPSPASSTPVASSDHMGRHGKETGKERGREVSWRQTLTKCCKLVDIGRSADHDRVGRYRSLERFLGHANRGFKPVTV